MLELYTNVFSLGNPNAMVCVDCDNSELQSSMWIAT